MLRALGIWESSLGKDHPQVAIGLSNLGQLLEKTTFRAEAEPFFRRALAINEASFGRHHPNVARALGNLAGLLRYTNRLAEAEPIYRRSLAINEASFGPDHPDVATDLNNLAGLLQKLNRLAEAEPLYRRALAINEKSLGPEHPDVATALNNLAWLRAEQGDWAEAARLTRRAVPGMIAGGRSNRDSRAGAGKANLIENAVALRAFARAVHRATPDFPQAREEAFVVAQWATQSGAAEAVAQMSVRFARGSGPLAEAVRARQDLSTRRQGEDKRLLAAVGAGDATLTAQLRDSVAVLDAELDALDARLARDFPEYADLASPKPLSLAAAQAELAPNEALVVFLDIPKFGRLPEETVAWVSTKDDVRWASIPLGTAALADKVAALRCGLDGSNWEDATRRARCEKLLSADNGVRPMGLTPKLDANDWPPFDLAKAHELYQALFGPFADMIEGKRLLIVPAGPLTTLPFHVLVTSPSPRERGEGDSGVPTLADYRAAAWLALEHPITILPSVGSLKALRRLPPSQAREPYIAFGNPLLEGNGGKNQTALAELARAKQRCPLDLETLRQKVAEAAKSAPVLGLFFRGGAPDLALVRAQAPLPETADEICAVAKSLGALGKEDETVFLGARATEANLKTMSREGKLARHSVLHLATHGLLSGESETILKSKAEPALLLTPPKDGASPEALEEDDGLLHASEAAQMNLDVDWVVLSACNTAAGAGDAEALSGLARAFFYAKARSLLVSHWYVSSDAAVKLVTGAFAALKAAPKIGRAEGLRRSMTALIQNGQPHEAHPSIWAPFVLVGEGGTGR